MTSTRGCGSDTATKIVTVLPLPNPGKIIGPATLCLGTKVTLTDTIAGGIWSYFIGNVHINSAGIVTPWNEGADTIYYLVSSTFCGSATAKLPVTVLTHDQCHLAVANVENQDGLQINVYPNPVYNGTLNIDLTNNTQSLQLEVYNLLGQKVISQILEGDKNQISVANLPIGTYYYMCYANGTKVGTGRFVKN